jgi:PAS domain S-box-containing protein/putative nucleotidyltransferase with HDIG domain
MTTPPTPLRLLLVEDNLIDAQLIERELRAAGLSFTATRVDTAADFLAGLEGRVDLVLTDYTLPAFDGMRAIALARQAAPDVPVVVVTGSIDEETAVACMKAGAVDYVLKGRLERLPLAVEAAVERARLEAEHRRAQEELRRVWRAVEQSPAIILMTDRRGTIEYVNPKFTEVTGYALAEVIGANPRILKSGRIPAETYQDLWATIADGREWRGELLNRKKNGDLFWNQVSISPIRGGRDNAITHFVAVQEDVTERRRRERELTARASLTATLNREAPRDDMVSLALDQLLLLTEADAACFLSPLAGVGEIRVEAARGRWAGWEGLLASPSAGPLRQVVVGGEPYFGGEGPLSAPGSLQTLSVIGLPVVSQGNTVGHLWVGRMLDLARDPFTGDELHLAEVLAEVAGAAILRATLHDQTQRRLQRLMAVKAIDEAIASSLDVRLTLNVVIDHVRPQLGADACSILLLNPHFRALEYAAGRGFRAPGYQRFRVRLGEGTVGIAALERRVEGTPDRCAERATPSRAALLAQDGFVAHWAAPLITKGQVIGALEVLHRTPLHPDAEWLDFLAALAEQAAIAIENARLFSELQRSNDDLALAYDATIEGWVRALDMRDRETEGHTHRVTEATLELARQLGMGDQELVHARRGALLHDIGKMAIPDVILHKPGPLSEEERKVMEQHTVYAHEWLSPIRFLRPALDIPYCHHERMDGSGYPRGLRGNEIPLAARIFAVVDVWDALRSERVYRSAWPEERVFEYLQSLSGTLLDAPVVSTFLQLRSAS